MSKERPILFSTEMVQAILDGRKTQTRRIKCRCEPGDILWVRETWTNSTVVPTADMLDEDGRYRNPYWKWVYKADCENGGEMYFKWKPSLFMPRAACRLLLRVENVRTERLSDITEEDAQCEGVPMAEENGYYGALPGFIRLWDSLNAKRGFGWDANPLVYVISFCVIKEVGI